MPRRSPDSGLSSASLPLTTLNIGLWEDDVGADRIRCNAVMARMYGLTEAEATHGISWTHLSSIFHPEDLDGDTVRRRRVREEGGLFAWEHRIIPASGIVRWVLSRGHFKRDANGRVRGHGIVIDVTEGRTDWQFDGTASFLGAPVISGSIAEQMAESALSLWEMSHNLDADGEKRIRPLLEAVLFELGRQIAASLSDHSTGQPHKLSPDPKMH